MGKKSKWTDKQLNLFCRANEGNEKALTKIMRDDLLQEWVSWNVACRIVTDSVTFAAAEVERRGLEFPDRKTEFVKIMDEYRAIATEHEAAMRDGMTTRCLEILFTAVA